MKLPGGCGERSGKVVELERALYGVKQAGRQWFLFGMEQCREDPCEFRKMGNKEVVLNLVVYVDDLLVSGNETVCEKLLGALYGQFSIQTLGGRE